MEVRQAEIAADKGEDACCGKSSCAWAADAGKGLKQGAET